MWSKARFYASDYQWIQQESTLWKRDLWTKTGASLDKSLQYAGDFELWLRFFRHEKLYVVPFLIGGFRMRRSGQKSVEHLDSYLKEVRKCFRKQVSLLWYMLLPCILLDKILVSVPMVKGLYYKSGLRGVLGYPPKMEFDPKVQKILIR